MTSHEVVPACRVENFHSGITPWDGQLHREPLQDVERRHQQARIECLKCPLLETCEEYLHDMERQGNRVDGVIAARYSDVPFPLGSKPPVEIQTHCRACNTHMRPARRIIPFREGDPEAIHAGEGLCDTCFPNFKRRYPKPPKPTHTPNHPHK